MGNSIEKRKLRLGHDLAIWLAFACLAQGGRSFVTPGPCPRDANCLDSGFLCRRTVFSSISLWELRERAFCLPTFTLPTLQCYSIHRLASAINCLTGTASSTYILLFENPPSRLVMAELAPYDQRPHQLSKPHRLFRRSQDQKPFLGLETPREKTLPRSALSSRYALRGEQACLIDFSAGTATPSSSRRPPRPKPNIQSTSWVDQEKNKETRVSIAEIS